MIFSTFPSINLQHFDPIDYDSDYDSAYYRLRSLNLQVGLELQCSDTGNSRFGLIDLNFC